MDGKQSRQILFFAAGVIALIGTIQFNLVRISQLRGSWRDSADAVAAQTEANQPLSQADLASLKKTTITRQENLGKAVPSKSNSANDIDVLLKDPSMAQKWDLTSIHAQLAWKRHRALGSRKVKVCVIDTGADVNHPDLKANIWTNPGESGKDLAGRDKATNGVDDDLDGCVDDVHGCNLIAGNGDVTDHHGHGTHVAGIIGATGVNGLGVVGVSPRVTLIIAKYYDPTTPSENTLLNTVKAIRYCVAHNVDIINYSSVGVEPSPLERQAIALARDKGILFVAAAGNDDSNSDVHKYYPADYGLDNIISVTAYDRDDNVLSSSNYGARTVDIAAPGKNIYSTLPGGLYGHLTGTSQATAVVTGVAALIKSQFPDFDATRLIRHLTETGDLDPIKLAGKTRYQKRLNAYRALAILDSTESVSGTVVRNAANISPDQFAVGKRDVADEGANVGLPKGVTEFGLDLQAILRKQQDRHLHQN